jgi:hypothetical protein
MLAGGISAVLCDGILPALTTQPRACNSRSVYRRTARARNTDALPFLPSALPHAVQPSPTGMPAMLYSVINEPALTGGGSPHGI